jgi:hypothetical protein
MGTTAEKIARNVAVQVKAPVVDLAAHRSARQIIKDAQIDRDDLQRLIAKGLDPSHAVYVHAHALISMTAEQLSTTKEARQFTRIVSAAEDTYMPGYPPMSPVTTSHFTMWALFDVEFGQSRETIGTCFLRIAELTGLPAGLRATAAALQASRLGLYVHCGHEGRFVRLREIGSQQITRSLITSGYCGEIGEIWLARLLPPADVASDYHIAFTTPYIIRGPSETAWIDYLDRERQRVGSKSLARKMDATAYIMKYGPSVNHWNEYIFCGYSGHCQEAIFLTGIPDIKSSLPHA